MLSFTPARICAGVAAAVTIAIGRFFGLFRRWRKTVAPPITDRTPVAPTSSQLDLPEPERAINSCSWCGTGTDGSRCEKCALAEYWAWRT